MGVGFIRDKLEIKFLILYVTAGVAEPMPLSDIQALTTNARSSPTSLASTISIFPSVSTNW